MSTWFCTNKQGQNYDNALPLAGSRLVGDSPAPTAGMIRKENEQPRTTPKLSPSTWAAGVPLCYLTGSESFENCGLCIFFLGTGI